MTLTELFVCFQGRLLRELAAASEARHEIIGLAYGQRCPEIQDDSLMVAGGAGDLFQSKRDVGLSPQIKLDICMDRKGIKARSAHASPLTVGAHEPFVDGETRLFANGAGNRSQPPLDFLLS